MEGDRDRPRLPLVAALILRAYPPAFRARHGEQIALFLAAERQEAGDRGPLPGLRYWSVACLDLVLGVARTRLAARKADALAAARSTMRSETLRTERNTMDHLKQDLRYAGRSLARRPGWTLAAALTLALGIGASTAIFSLVNGVLLSPLPFADSERLVSMGVFVPESGRSRNVVSFPVYEAIRDAEDATTGLGCYSVLPATVDFGAGAERMDAGILSSPALEALGTLPAAGRLFQDADDLEDATPTALLSHALWQQRFGGDPSAVGRVIHIDETPTEIVGIMPPSFVFPDQDTRFWVSMAGQARMESRHYLSLIGRYRPGVEPGSAAARLGAIRLDVPTGSPGELRTVGVATQSFLETLVGDIAPQLMLFLLAVGAVLVIGCINVANLTLGRAATRGQELSLRVALGAGRLRLVRQLLTESLLLGLLGGAMGLVVAVAVDRGLLALAADQIPRGGSPGIDVRAFAFVLGLSSVVGIAIGLLPALHASRPDVRGTLGTAVRGGTGSRTSHRLRGVLAVAQIALAATLLTNAGAVTSSLERLVSVDTGLDTEGVLSFRPMLTRDYDTLERRRAFYRDLDQRLRAVPGVVEVGFTATAPFGGSRIAEEILVDGQPRPASEDDEVLADVQIVDPRFFETVGLDARIGRLFADRDARSSAPVAVVNETLARQFFGDGQAAIGGRVVVGIDAYLRTVEIVGVVPDIRPYRLTREIQPMVFEVMHRSHEEWEARPSLVVQTRDTRVESVMAAIPEVVRAIDPTIPIARMFSFDSRLDGQLVLPRLRMRVMAVFAVSALFLAVVGVYGLMTFFALERTREIGIRLALGAKRWQILAWLGRRGAAITGFGLVLGILGARASARLLEGHLFELETFDPRIFALSALFLGVAAWVAVMLPARRASRLDPVETLRSE